MTPTISWHRSRDHRNWWAEVEDLRISVARNDTDTEIGYDDWRWEMARIERTGNMTRVIIFAGVGGGKKFRKAKQEAAEALRRELEMRKGQP